jgi:hypothetical protein
MTSAVVIDICDAVVVVLNGATLSQPLTAERTYLSILDLDTLDGLQVFVSPAMLTVSRFDLAPRQAFNPQIQIGMRKRVTLATADIDPLIILTQEIIQLFRPVWLPGTAARVQTIENTPVFDAMALDEKHVFITTILLTFQLTLP